MSEVIFAMIAAIVGSVMVFVIILTLFYFSIWLSIKAIKRLKRERQIADDADALKHLEDEIISAELQIKKLIVSDAWKIRSLCLWR